MHRLFVALRPPRSVRDRLLATMSGVPDARWQDDEQLHVTVRFVGEVDRPAAEAVAEALAGIRAGAITARIEGVGRFDKRGRATALWARVTPRDPLEALFRKVDRAIAAAGLPPEGRAYLPHVTLARLPSRGLPEEAVAPWLAVQAALATPEFRLEHLVLYESHLGHGGARYEAVARWPLA